MSNRVELTKGIFAEITLADRSDAEAVQRVGGKYALPGDTEAPGTEHDSILVFISLLRILILVLGLGFVAEIPPSAAEISEVKASTNTVVLTIEGKVEYQKASSGAWMLVQTNQVLSVGDRLRTGERSRASVRLRDLSVLRLGESTSIEIEAPAQGRTKSSIKVQTGIMYFQGKEKAIEHQIRTPLVRSAIRG